METNQVILLVDDEQAIAEMTAAILMSCGYEVITAGSGEEAVALSAQRQGKIDLALVDMMMPGMDGHATAQALRRQRPVLPVVMISGLYHEDRRDTTMIARAIYHLNKPFTLEKLVDTVHEALGASAPSPSLAEPAWAVRELVPA